MIFSIITMLLCSAITIIVCILGKKKYAEYQELKVQCEETQATKIAAMVAASKALSEESNAKENLRSINENVKLGIEQLNNNKQALIDQEKIIRDSLEQERAQWFKDLCDKQTNALLATQKEFTEQFLETNSVKMAAAKELAAQIHQLRSTVSSAVEVARHKMEEAESQNFYRLQLTEDAKNDIATLRSIEGSLRNPEAINKVIWKMYYEKPYTDLIGRLGIAANTTGIYKITNIENQMTYVGQAVSVSERWRQHIRRGVGADTPTQNKLYPAMKKYGPENFTFELIEKCPPAKLNEREDYWQEFYKAKEFGYSIK